MKKIIKNFNNLVREQYSKFRIKQIITSTLVTLVSF